MTRHLGTFSRREFLVRTAVATALTACPPVSRSLGAAASIERRDVARVLFDRRATQAVAFGLEAARRGVEALAVDDDAGTVWIHEIAPIWQTVTGLGAEARSLKAAAIAGLTTRAPLFCLELLGRDYGMRVVYRGQHTRPASGCARHTFAGRSVSPRWEAQLADAGAEWGGVAVTLALTRPVDPVMDSRIGLLDLEPGRDADRSLFSWVIAPVDAARALAGRRV
jgi:hypothetical protein